MKVNDYAVFTECLENGINRGYRRSFKHTDTPSEEHMKQEIYNAVLNEVCDYFKFHFGDEGSPPDGDEVGESHK